MTYNKVRRKLKKLYESEIKNIIYKQKSSYILYDTYKVTNLNGLWEVRRFGQFINMFEASATAISWCLADKYNQIMLAYNLMSLDRRLQIKKNEIAVQKEYIKVENDTQRTEIASMRITNDLYICKSIKNEIKDDCLSTKYIQIKGYIKQ